MRKYRAGSVAAAVGPPTSHLGHEARARAGASASKKVQPASRRERPEPIPRIDDSHSLAPGAPGAPGDPREAPEAPGGAAGRPPARGRASGAAARRTAAAGVHPQALWCHSRDSSVCRPREIRGALTSCLSSTRGSGSNDGNGHDDDDNDNIGRRSL